MDTTEPLTHTSIPWTAKRSNLSVLKEISPEYSLEELLLKLMLQYFGHLMQRADILEKTLILMLGKIEGRRRRGRQRMRWLGGTIDSMDLSLSTLWEMVTDREPGGLQSKGSPIVRHDLETKQQRLHVLSSVPYKGWLRQPCL